MSSSSSYTTPPHTPTQRLSSRIYAAPKYSPPPSSPRSPSREGGRAYPFPSVRSHSHLATGTDSSASGSGSGSNMSHRTSSATMTSPSTPEYGPGARLVFPPQTASPTLAAEAKHQAQLETYRRSSKGRLSSSASSSSPSRDTRGRQDRDGDREKKEKRYRGLSAKLRAMGRRLSAITEDGGESGASGRRTSNTYFVLHAAALVASAPLRMRKRRLFSCLSLVFTLYFVLHICVFRSFSKTDPYDTPHGAPKRSQKLSDRTKTSASRAVKTTRPQLPPHVLAKMAHDHPIVDGILHVTPNSTIHPIYQLIRDARTEWDAKVARQSKTLKDAVAEYRRRHHRAPPVGFDKWWAYVQENNVPLPDEYDQIARDVYPFFALAPKELEERLDDATQYPDTYTIKVKHGSVRTIASPGLDIEGADMRLDGQIELLRPIARYLPDLQATYSVHDSADRLMSWEHRVDLMEAVSEGEWFDERDNADFTARGYLAGCPNSARLKLANPPARPIKSFVASARAQTDLCAHPELLEMHGSTAGKHPHVFPLSPLFTLSKTGLHAEVLGVPTEQWVGADELPYVPWTEKYDERLLWRGSNTGAHYSEEKDWTNTHRVRLVRELNTKWGQLDVLPAPKSMGGKRLSASSKEVGKQFLNHWAADVMFAGEPIQCDEADGTCRQLKEQYKFTQDRMSFEDAMQYKYVLDVDGNAWSARFNRLLTSGSLVLKSTIMPEWWTDRIAPWVHYVPIQLDYSDVYDILTFFRGEPSTSKGGESALAQSIATAGREWALTHWRKEDMTAYAFRMYLEWARVTSPNRSRMDFVYSEEMEVVKD